MSKPVLTLLLALLLLLFGLIGCQLQPPPAEDAAALLPNLSGYNTIEGESFTDALTTLGVMATLGGLPEFGAPIAAISEIVGCYQEAGAVSARVYSQQTDPRNSGIVAIGDRKALQNPVTFLRCVPGATSGTESGEPVLQPCAASYTLSKDDNDFYILYAGLTTDMCHTFCTNLEGCTAH
ncbi:MAG: hypothetical protein H6659_15560 [Ardenticatenaceae bacterium]|nr:hypothetical protein [Anaerolineales bacterium]MCB8985248.1 hypothetical protein [Ardenticatenaceae bacterium]MCB8988002.1 hypothetical protein [Ardenticatenaceae bacterium]